MPTFRKLYRKLISNGTGTFQNGLPKGTYTLQVQYSKIDIFSFVFQLIDWIRLSCVEFLRSKTIHNQYNIVDGRQESISWLGLYYCWSHFICYIYYFSSFT